MLRVGIAYRFKIFHIVFDDALLDRSFFRKCVNEDGILGDLIHKLPVHRFHSALHDTV